MSGSATITILGNIGSVPAERLRYSDGSNGGVEGTAVCRVGIAVSSRKQDAPPVWFNCVFFGKQAELLVAHFGKGDGIQVVAEPQTDVFTDPNTGVERSQVEWLVNKLTFLPIRKEAAQSGQAAQVAQVSDPIRRAQPVQQAQRPIVRTYPQGNAVVQPVQQGPQATTTRMRAQALAQAAQAAKAAPAPAYEDELFAPEDDFVD